MNREEFMAQLERLLFDIPANEREEAIRYYNDYFDEAGPENETSVIQELGSPGRVAASIKENLRYESKAESAWERKSDSRYAVSTYERKGAGKWALIIILLVFASPILFGVGGGLIGLAVGIVGVVFGVVLAVLAAAIGCSIGGIAVFIRGFYWMISSNFVLGLMGMGGGLLFLAVGILCSLLFVWFAFKWCPALVRKFVNLISGILNKRKGESPS